MHVQNAFMNRRLTALARMTRELEHCRMPGETLRIVRRSFAEVDGSVRLILVSTQGLPVGQYRVAPLDTGDEAAGTPFESSPEGSAVHCGGFLGDIVARREPQLIVDVDWSHDPYFGQTLRSYASVIAVPLVGARLPMTWAVLLKKSPDRFTVSDFAQAVERAALVGALLENQILAAELSRANELIDLEAQQVGELQRALLPASLPRNAGLEIAASLEPLGRAGGDLYDFFPLTDGTGDPARWCVFIADTAGHGLAASVIMAIVQAVLHARPAGLTNPAGLLTHANRQLCARGINGFVTAFLGVYEPHTRLLRYSNAGHPPPLHRSGSGGSIRALDAARSYPVGIDASETFQEATVQLAPHDLLLLYTDGIIEATGPVTTDRFSVDRLTRILLHAADEPHEVINGVRRAVSFHEEDQPRKDDHTLIAARVL